MSLTPTSHEPPRQLTLEERVDMHDRMLRAVEDAHEHLTNQVAEIIVTTREMRKEFPQMVAEGIVAAAANPATWAAVRAGARREARDAAGNAFLGTLSSISGKLFWTALIIWVLYTTGGLPAVAGWLKFSTAANP